MKLKHVLSLLTVLAVATGSVGLITYATTGAGASSDEVIRALLKWSAYLLMGPAFLGVSVWILYQKKKQWVALNLKWGKHAKELKLDFHPGTGLNWLAPAAGTRVGLSGTRNEVAIHVSTGQCGSSGGNDTGGFYRTDVTVVAPHLPDGMFLMVGKAGWGTDRMKVSTGDASFDAQYHVNSAHTQMAGTMVDGHFRKNFASLSALRANVKITGYKGAKGAKDEVCLQWDGSEEDLQVFELAIETATHLVRRA